MLFLVGTEELLDKNVRNKDLKKMSTIKYIRSVVAKPEVYKY